jgi:hypothetical protein
MLWRVPNNTGLRLLSSDPLRALLQTWLAAIPVNPLNESVQILHHILGVGFS